MNRNQNFDDFLTQQLHATQTYLDDDGFSANVMASIPTSKKLNPFFEKIILVLPVTIIALSVLSQFSWRELVQWGYAWILTVEQVDLAEVAVAIAVACLSLPALWVLRRLQFI